MEQGWELHSWRYLDFSPHQLDLIEIDCWTHDRLFEGRDCQVSMPDLPEDFRYLLGDLQSGLSSSHWEKSVLVMLSGV
jgi:hypothetical protein